MMIRFIFQRRQAAGNRIPGNRVKNLCEDSPETVGISDTCLNVIRPFIHQSSRFRSILQENNGGERGGRETENRDTGGIAKLPKETENSG
jgi:hypothetical protein